MITEKDQEIVRRLRGNSRVKLTELSRNLNIPVTTLYSKLRKYQEKLIRKNTCLVDFTKFGYHKSVYLILKAREKKNELESFLNKQDCLNSLIRINYGSDFLAECIFRNEKEITEFLEILEDNFQAGVQMHNVIEEIKKENFMARDSRGETPEKTKKNEI